jgi:uncharacterized protein YegJ (DUF2314 family)
MPPKLQAIALISLLFLATSCEENSRPPANPGGDPVVEFDDTDDEMNSAIKNARDSVQEFISALASPSPGHRYIVKAKIEADGASEHIWLEPVRFADGAFTGLLANNPNSIHSIRAGAAHTCKTGEISDWAILGPNDEIIAGAYTIKVMQTRMDPP